MKRWQVSWYRVLEITVGCCAAMVAAMALGLDNPMSAGVIAILSIQDTKRDTLRAAADRFAAFAMAVFLSFLCFSLLGYHIWAFALYLLPFTLLCYALKLHSSIPICTVLVTHFWLAGHMRLTLLLNETYLMLLGTGIAILLHLFVPGSLAGMKREQRAIEDSIRTLLTDFAGVLRCAQEKDVLAADFARLTALLDTAREKAASLLGNTLTRDVRYYVRYVDLRTAQAAVLRRMLDTLDPRLTTPIAQAYPIADHLCHIASLFHETNDAKDLLRRTEALLETYRSEPLPQTRWEFEIRAMLYRILIDIEQLLTLKSSFFESLSEDDRKRYLPEQAK